MRLFVILPVLILSGCATANVANIPGNTQANNRLKADIVNMINMVERAQAPHCRYQIIDTKVTGVVGDTVTEEWTVESCGKNIIYPVELTPDPKGGTFFGIQTPDKKDRE
ncbi:MAG: hypothetical protein WC676_03395 [Candidatus Omnitrophota bacterium]